MIPGWRPSFFKIIASSKSHEELRIPPYFKEYVSMETFERVILRGPSGGHWQVKLQNRPGGIFLEVGWSQFVRDHSLGDYEFLIFTYDGDARFDVQIFEKSGCEQTYVSTDKHNLDSPCPPCGESKSGKPRKVEPDFACSPNGKRKRGRPRINLSDHSHLCRPTKPPGSVFGEGQLSDPKTAQEKKRVRRKIEDNNGREAMEAPDPPVREPRRLAGRKLHPLSAKSIKALKMTGTFSSSHPHFWCCMRGYNISVSFIMQVPCSFSKSHLPRCKSTVTLRNSEGKTWEVTAAYSGRTHAFSGGWASFARQNKVRSGDVCVFELIDKNLMQVHIFPKEAAV